MNEGFKVFEALLSGASKSCNSVDYINSSEEQLKYTSKLVELLSRMGLDYCNKHNIDVDIISRFRAKKYYLLYKGLNFKDKYITGQKTVNSITLLKGEEVQNIIPGRTIHYNDLLFWIKEIRKH